MDYPTRPIHPIRPVARVDALDAAESADRSRPFVETLFAGRLPGVRVYRETSFGDAVPFRAVTLSPTPETFGGGENPTLLLRDTSGPCGEEPSENAGRVRGVARVRRPGEPTLLDAARAGEIVPEFAYAALRESAAREALRSELEGIPGGERRFKSLLEILRSSPPVTPETVRSLVAARRAVIPANVGHRGLEPMVIGRDFATKVNANIGTAPGDRRPPEDLGRLASALLSGADTVMDLSVGPGMTQARRAVLAASPVPVGTVPVYEALERAGGDPRDLRWEHFRDAMIAQAEDGVDYMTIHAGVLRRHVEAAAGRLTGIVSRGGGILAAQMKATGGENPLFEHFDEILEIARTYDVTLSLGDGLRSGSIHDANDAAQLGELATLGGLNRRAGDAGVQVMIEGPGHIPYGGIALNQVLEEAHCAGAPFYTLGPLVADSGAGYDHVTAAMGAAAIGAAGTAMLCFVTPKEHLGLPDEADVREGMAVFRLAAHAADLAKGNPEALARDWLMSAARFEFRWRDQYLLSVDPERAARLRGESLSGTGADEAHFCSMCGPKFCPMKLSRDWFGDDRER